MFSSFKAIIEFIKLLLNTYQFLDNQISKAQYDSAISKRKESYDKFISADRAGRLEVLRDENNE